MVYSLIIRFNKYCKNWTDNAATNEEFIHNTMKKWRNVFKNEGRVYISDILIDLGAGKLNILNDMAWDYCILKNSELKYLDYELFGYRGSSDFKLTLPYNHYVAIVEPPETDFH